MLIQFNDSLIQLVLWRIVETGDITSGLILYVTHKALYTFFPLLSQLSNKGSKIV